MIYARRRLAGSTRERALIFHPNALERDDYTNYFD